MKTALAFLLAITGCAWGQGYPYSYPAADGCNMVTVRSPTHSEVTMKSCNLGDPPLFLGIPDPRENKIGPIGWQRTIWPTIVRACAVPSGPRQTCTQWEGDCCMAMTVYQQPLSEMEKPWEPLHPLVEIEPCPTQEYGYYSSCAGVANLLSYSRADSVIRLDREPVDEAAFWRHEYFTLMGRYEAHLRSDVAPVHKHK